MRRWCWGNRDRQLAPECILCRTPGLTYWRRCSTFTPATSWFSKITCIYHPGCAIPSHHQAFARASSAWKHFLLKTKVIICFRERRPRTEPCATNPQCWLSFPVHTENSTPALLASLKPRKHTVGFSRAKVTGNKADVAALYFVRCLPLRSQQNVELIIKLQPPSPREGLPSSLTLHS